MYSIGTAMLLWRAKHSLSQTESAKLAGITLQTWNQVENGRQKPSKLTETKIRMVIEGDDECKEVSAD